MGQNVDFADELYVVVEAVRVPGSPLLVFGLLSTTRPVVIFVFGRECFSGAAAEGLLIAVNFAGQLDQLLLRKTQHRADGLTSPLKDLLRPFLGALVVHEDVILQKLRAEVDLGLGMIELVRHGLLRGLSGRSLPPKTLPRSITPFNEEKMGLARGRDRCRGCCGPLA